MLRELPSCGFDAIDALETHYGNPRTHQPLGLAHAAADELLTWLGFANVVRSTR